jgi:protoporphyrinogen oxidase
MERIVILGAGMAGFGAAHRLLSEGVRPTIYEKNPYWGGHAASYDHGNGFVYDEGPHVSFTKIERLKELFAESVHHEYFEHKEKVTNYWKGFWIKHPAQCNLYGLPTDILVPILRDFIEAQQSTKNRYPSLCGLALCQLWQDLRRNISDGVHGQVPHDHG